MSIKNSKLVVKIKGFFSKFKKLKSEDLENVTGAGEPEEFDWKTKGYVTPTHPEPTDPNWAFKALGPNYAADMGKAKLDAMKRSQEYKDNLNKNKKGN